MTVKEQFDARMNKWALLNHPFYQSWESGDLPLPALKAYAEEYGAFIATMPMGWQTLGDQDTAEEEREHTELWQRFAAGLKTEISDARLSAAVALVRESNALFASPQSALGALYAFEAQQPETARSKLQGLRDHYDLPADVEPYFEIHSHNEHEAQKLLAMIDALSAEDREIALQACERMAKSLWDALSDIYDTHVKM